MSRPILAQFKKLCRTLGIRRWPRRELRTLSARVAVARPQGGGGEASDAAQSQAVWESYARRVSEDARAACDWAAPERELL